MQGGISARGLSTDLRTGLAFCTRLPFVGGVSATGSDVARASWTFPIAGALVGLIGAFAYWLADRLGLPPFVSATLAVAATMLATGCLHEDGLADTVDGFGGGGTTRAQARDHARQPDRRLRGLGAVYLADAQGGRDREPSSSLIWWRRRCLPPMRARAPRFRCSCGACQRHGETGYWPTQADRPPACASIAVLLGLIALVIGLGFGGALTAVALLALGVGPLAWISIRQVGGQTGDVLGAVEQAGEILILLVAASWLQA